MNVVAQVRKFCTPARLYVYVSVFITLVLLVQNIGSCGVFKAGSMECAVTSLVPIFVGQILYIAFWTLVLQGLCKIGYESLSWFVLLFPIIMFFVLLSVLMLAAGSAGGSMSPNREVRSFTSEFRQV